MAVFSPLDDYRGSTSEQAPSASFYIPSSSLFTCRPAIFRCIA
jgi:hypothetical protein